ncbi:hypothetical protein JYU34_008165 [Plutella xylostella]|uniref:AD domain-containing protein n=1 Tax=Plutella xylostella TaxID=51655 RepID=A0ABQ7QNZ3_PLUXY|nr:hypothetical protein JYU34_008165 [Plutella xylostella]
MSDLPVAELENIHLKPLEDPIFQLTLIDKYVTLETIKNGTYSGFVHSIDPISKSVILSVPSEDTFKVHLILGHSILNISETTPPNDKRPQKQNTVKLTEEEILARKNQVFSWLKKNLLPVVEKENSIDIGNVSLMPPYGVSDLCTDNAVIAVEIRKILENIPADFVA